MEELQDFTDQDTDYYAFFNVSKEATESEITNAYRRMSRLYHPDKHFDPEKKRQAEILFSKARRIYEVLSNSQTRAIYDTLGPSALATSGWELVERQFGPDEIKQEYERLVRKREEQLLMEEAHPHGLVGITVNAVDLLSALTEMDESGDIDKSSLLPEVVGMRISQSVEAPLTLNDRIILGGSLSSENGRGSGNLSLIWRRIINDRMWSEAEMNLVDNPSIGVKAVRTFSSRMYGSAQLIAQIDRNGDLVPGMAFSLTRQLDKHINGTLTLVLGRNQTVTTTISYDDITTNHGSVTIAVGRPILFVLFSYTRRLTEIDAKIKAALRLGTDGILTETSYERRLTERNSIMCGCRVHFPRGITLKFRFQRAAQTYLANIQLCQDEVALGPFLYGVIVPIVVYNVLKWALLPFWKRLAAEKNSKDRARINAKKLEAETAILLMQEMYDRVKDDEVRKRGLVILEAWYGNLAGTVDEGAISQNAVNVTVPLQVLTKDSKLILPPGSKKNLPGFYDPCPNEEKQLVVIYSFRGMPHKTTVQENEPLAIPKSSHQQDGE